MNVIIKKIFNLILIFAVALTATVEYDKHIISVFASTQNAETKTVSESEELTSDKVAAWGWQIRMTDEDLNDYSNVTFRAIFKAPKPGTSIVVGEKTLIVQSFGSVFLCDDDKSGKAANRTYDGKDMMLSHVPYGTVASNNGPLTLYLSMTNIPVYGYINSNASVFNKQQVESLNETYDENTVYYSTIMTNMNGYLANTLLVRGFVIAKDLAGNEYFVYSERTRICSVAYIAHSMYINNLAGSGVKHNYLYDHILHSEELRLVHENNKEFPYYYENPIEYGYSDVVRP